MNISSKKKQQFTYCKNSFQVVFLFLLDLVDAVHLNRRSSVFIHSWPQRRNTHKNNKTTQYFKVRCNNKQFNTCDSNNLRTLWHAQVARRCRALVLVVRDDIVHAARLLIEQAELVVGAHDAREHVVATTQREAIIRACAMMKTHYFF